MSESATLYEVAPEGGKVTLRLDAGLYPLDVVYGASYVFIDRAYVLLGRDGDAITVDFASKDEGADEAALRALAGDFSNELLSQALRRRITESNGPLLEAIVSAALAGASGTASPASFLDDDEEDDDDLDFLDDPLGIAVPWEDKFTAEGKAGAQGDGQAAAEAAPDAEDAGASGEASEATAEGASGEAAAPTEEGA